MTMGYKSPDQEYLEEAKRDRLRARVAELEAENEKLKRLIDVAYDERNHWHAWARRAEFFARAWKRAAKKYRSV